MGIFDLFGSRDLDLDLMTFIYELDPYVFPANMNFLRQGFRKLASDRQADRHTDTTEIIYHAASRVVKKLNNRKRWQLSMHCHLRPPVPPVILSFDHEAGSSDP